MIGDGMVWRLEVCRCNANGNKCHAQAEGYSQHLSHLASSGTPSVAETGSVRVAFDNVCDQLDRNGVGFVSREELQTRAVAQRRCAEFAPEEAHSSSGRPPHRSMRTVVGKDIVRPAQRSVEPEQRAGGVPPVRRVRHEHGVGQADAESRRLLCSVQKGWLRM